MLDKLHVQNNGDALFSFLEVQWALKRLCALLFICASVLSVFCSACSPNTLHRVSAYLCLLPELPDGEDTSYDKEFLLELLVGTS